MNDSYGKTSSYGPQIQATRLFEKTSASGNTYFMGRWGNCRITLLKAREPAEDGTPVWNLVLSEAPKPADEKKHTR
jgi:hypothetical protein